MSADETNATQRGADRRSRAVVAVETMRREMALLADVLQSEDSATANLVAALQSDRSIADVIAGAPVAPTRVKLTERVLAFDHARKAARHAIVTLLIAEGFTIAEVADVFGVSRQLASRLIHEVQAADAVGAAEPT